MFLDIISILCDPIAFNLLSDVTIVLRSVNVNPIFLYVIYILSLSHWALFFCNGFEIEQHNIEVTASGRGTIDPVVSDDDLVIMIIFTVPSVCWWIIFIYYTLSFK